MDRPRDAGIIRSQRAREELAKAWLLDVLERTPMREIEHVPIAWIAAEGPTLVADIVRGLASAAPGELELPTEGIERVEKLADLRHGDAAAEIPRDLAALQALLIDALRREVPERRMGAFAGSVERLATIFGDIQAQVAERLVQERSGGAPVDPLTGLPGPAQLHEWIRILLTEQRRHGEPFALMMIDVDGLARINDAYGHEAGDQVLRAIAAVVRRQLRPVDRAFRLAEDELCVLCPRQDASDALPMARHLCHLVDDSQAETGPRIAISVGLAACPEHGEDAEELLRAAEEAAWTAKADGRGVAVRDR